jgi:predicted nucleotide-binding protein
VGLLGRDRVSVLYKAPLELPSDLGGLGHIEMDGDWRYRLAKELASAGMRVDLSRLLAP